MLTSIKALIEAEKDETTYALIMLDQVDCRNCYDMFRVITVVFHFKQLRHFQKPAKRRRWNKTTIRFCIILQGRSSSNYVFIRASEMMTLQKYPSSLHRQMHMMNDLLLFLIPFVKDCVAFKCKHNVSEKMNECNQFPTFSLLCAQEFFDTFATQSV